MNQATIIEITPAMIHAGLKVLYESGKINPKSSDDLTVEGIFRAMQETQCLESILTAVIQPEFQICGASKHDIEITPAMFEAGIAVCNARGLDSKTVTFLRDIFEAMAHGASEPSPVPGEYIDGWLRSDGK